MRAGVGATEHHAVVLPDPDARATLVGPPERRHERRQHEGERQPFGDDDVEQHVDGVGAARGRDLGQAPADPLAVADAPSSGRSPSGPTPTAPSALLRRLARPRAALARLGVGERRPSPLGVEPDHLAPPGQVLEQGLARRRMTSGSASATTCAPRAAATSDARSCCS